MTGLERFVEAKEQEIAALLRMGEEALRPWPGKRPSFLRALEGRGAGPLAVVAEYKRASPSRGVICETLEPEDVALQYASAGAGAVPPPEDCWGVLSGSSWEGVSSTGASPSRAGKSTFRSARHSRVPLEAKVTATAVSPPSVW